MNRLPWIRKEIRQLLPNFIIGLLLLLPAWLMPHSTSWLSSVGVMPFFVSLLLSPVFALLLCLDSFGREISSGTFPGLLSLPTSRHRIWWTKTLLLAIGLGCLWWSWWQTAHRFRSSTGAALDMDTLRTASLLFIGSTFSGALWIVLAFRQVAAGFWISLLAPAGLLMLTLRLVKPDTDPTAIVTGILTTYSLLGFAWGYRLFLRAQDANPANLEIPFTQPNPAFSRLFRVGHAGRREGITQTLLWKEIHLHQGIIVMAGMMILAHLGILAARNWGVAIENSALHLALKGFWGLWLVFPLLAGSALVSEERRLGVWESQLCLPVKHRRQWSIKMLVGLGISLVLGAVLPVTLESNTLLEQTRIDLSSVAVTNSSVGTIGTLVLWAKAALALPFDPQPLLILSMLSAGLYLLSSYASSCSRSLLHSLSVATACVFLATILLNHSWDPFTLEGIPQSRGPVGLAFMLAVLLITLLWLSYRNSRHTLVGPRLQRANVWVLMIAIVGASAASSAVYHRAWEYLAPLEKAHRPALLTPRERNDVRTIYTGSRLVVTTAEGRSWVAEILWKEGGLMQLFEEYGVESLRDPIQSVIGTNWTHIVPSRFGTVGIQRDGSLWILEQSAPYRHSAQKASNLTSQLPPLIRYGTQTDWKQATEFGYGPLIVKTDGTLWLWKYPKLGQPHSSEGVQLRVVSTNSDWAEIRSYQNWGACLMNRTGQAWIVEGAWAKPTPEDRLLDGTMLLRRTPYLDGNLAQKHAQISTRRGVSDFHVALGTNGTLFVSSIWQRSSGFHSVPRKLTRIPLDDGDGSQWKDIASDGENLVTIKSDGTLWRWNFRDSDTFAPGSYEKVRLGTQSDWVSVYCDYNDIICIAADGTVWARRFDKAGMQPLLAASRKPRLIGSLPVGQK